MWAICDRGTARAFFRGEAMICRAMSSRLPWTAGLRRAGTGPCVRAKRTRCSSSTGAMLDGLSEACSTDMCRGGGQVLGPLRRFKLQSTVPSNNAHRSQTQHRAHCIRKRDQAHMLHAFLQLAYFLPCQEAFVESVRFEQGLGISYKQKLCCLLQGKSSV